MTVITAPGQQQAGCRRALQDCWLVYSLDDPMLMVQVRSITKPVRLPATALPRYTTRKALLPSKPSMACPRFHSANMFTWWHQSRTHHGTVDAERCTLPATQWLLLLLQCRCSLLAVVAQPTQQGGFFELAKLAAAGQARERLPANTNKEMQQTEQIDRSSPRTHC